MDTEDWPSKKLRSHFPLIKKKNAQNPGSFDAFWKRKKASGVAEWCNVELFLLLSGGKKEMGKSDRDLKHPCECKGLGWLRLWRVSLSFSQSLSSYLPPFALFINQPFIKQKQLPALPKRWIDTFDKRTEYLPPLPSASSLHGNEGKSSCTV